MTFEGQYLTYAEYKQLGGAEIGKMPFNLLEFEARRQIDSRTQSRLKNSDEVPEEVKMCTNKLINSIKTYATEEIKGNVASENTDGYSVNYITADRISEVIKSKQNEFNEIIETYLYSVIFNGEHLLYCGVR